ncbi:hypothetical protein NHH03_15200 [Stieleria sp. TO1_6]|nr:hypothetical protein [Stieleria tagensis]
MTLISLVLTGCGPQDSAPKTSLFEDDHAVAKHRPDDLADVAVKLRERIGREDASEQTKHEIEDLVSWTAEIAADTNLSEFDWLPLYHASESLAKNLRSVEGTLTDKNRKQIESHCELVDQTVGQIPEPHSSLVKDQP